MVCTAHRLVAAVDAALTEQFDADVLEVLPREVGDGVEVVVALVHEAGEVLLEPEQPTPLPDVALCTTENTRTYRNELRGSGICSTE